jgi:cellulose synthase/poly-beta-1,6-N-acetylglucosamine synthase-like glycosyltransferase
MSDAAPVGRDDSFYEQLAARMRLAFVRLDVARIDPGAVRAISATTARALGVVPIAVTGMRLTLAMSNPANEEAIRIVRGLTGLRVFPVVSTPELVHAVLDHVHGAPTPVRRAPAAPRAPLRPARSQAEERRLALQYARHAGLEYVALDPQGGKDPVNHVAAQLLSYEQCHRLGVIPLATAPGVVTVAVGDPFDELTVKVVAGMTGRRPRFVVASPVEIDRAVERVFGALRASQPPPELDGQRVTTLMLGDLLVRTGLVTLQQVAEALEIQRRAGGRLGQILLHAGAVGERQLVETLADQLSLPDLDVSAFDPSPDALGLVPEPVARRYRFVPLAVRDHVLYLAMADPLDSDALVALRAHTMLPVRAIVTSRSALEALFQRVYRRRYIRVATADLLNRHPDESAFNVLTRRQAIVLALVVLVFVLFLLYDPIATVIGFNIASFAFYVSFSIYKLHLISHALQSKLELPVTAEDAHALDERTLPAYTILVPLFREANVVRALVNSISHLDYPRTKLDIKLICEEDDPETIDMLRAMSLPPHFRLVVVPSAVPKTKPKACNYGLIQAEGKYVVIYDAEDRPEPDQLKKIVAAFRRADERIVCIQCKLNYYNRNQNILTRWFTAEYSHWFDLLMPGLDAADAPIPLGGTSNHFITERLLELGAWDPYNVTEDADLGIRLHKAGYKTAIIDSTTYEEANSDLYNWIRQRSRWVKGYIQTWLVHMRHPVRFQRQVGWRSWFAFQFIIGGTFAGFLLNPVYWLITTLWVLSQAGVIQQVFPGLVYFIGALGLFIGNFVFTYLNVAGVMRRGYYDLAKYALLSPLYWALMSVGAWKGLLQLMYRPHYWEKTVHGLDVGMEAE